MMTGGSGYPLASYAPAPGGKTSAIDRTDGLRRGAVPRVVFARRRANGGGRSSLLSLLRLISYKLQCSRLHLRRKPTEPATYTAARRE